MLRLKTTEIGLLPKMTEEGVDEYRKAYGPVPLDEAGMEAKRKRKAEQRKLRTLGRKSSTFIVTSQSGFLVG